MGEQCPEQAADGITAFVLAAGDGEADIGVALSFAEAGGVLRVDEVG